MELRSEADLQRSEYRFMSRASLREFRQEFLTKGADWFERDGDRAVMITAAGQTKLAGAINAKKTAAASRTDADTEISKKTAARPAAVTTGGESQRTDHKLQIEETVPESSLEKKPAAVEAVVVQYKFANCHIITGTVAGELVKIRVHDNSNYRAGMVVRCLMDRPGQYTIVGRGPRWPGKW